MSQGHRVGMIGLDTSHVVAFAKLLNDPAVEHHVAGGQVVAAFPGGSPDFDLSINRVEGFTQELREKWGVQILDSPAAVAETVDLVFLESVDGRVHLDQFRQILPARRPTFIDKPMAVTSADAREIFRLAKDAGVPVMSSSSLRYSDELAAAMTPAIDQELGAIRGCDAYGPMALQPTQPGFFWYGIHSVEVMNRVMGTGCVRVQVDSNDHADIATGTWADGRVATVRGNRNCHSKFGVTIHREKGVQHVDLTAKGRPWYAAMLEVILKTLPTGKPDLAPEQTLEVIRFMEAANQSRADGSVVKL